jgi:aspartate racemase
MKIPGIIGGLGPESTIEYYRQIIALYRERNRDGSYPRMLINSIDLDAMRNLVEANKLPELADFLLLELKTLVRGGADFGLLAANTPHIVFDTVQRQSPIPLISIVEVACEAVRRLAIKRVGLFGTRFTMTGQFYREPFDRAQIALITPSPQEQNYIHEKYMDELINGIFLAETRQGLLAIVERMKTEEKIEALVLGGTELPLILGEVKKPPVPFLDTTRLHVEAVVERMLG